MKKEDIDRLIPEEEFQKIIHEKEFYFSKGREALQRWLDLKVSDQLKEDLIRLSGDYTQFQEIAELDPEIAKIKDLLFEIISYLDSHAKDKIKYNKYPDKRTVARASVRMGYWVDGLVKLKFKNAEITGPSIINAFYYILLPEENSPLLSESMREAVTKNLFKRPYNPKNFVLDLKEYFEKFDLKVENPENYTLLASSFLYKFYSEWGEQVIGLMASDGTGWHEEELYLESKYSGLIVWNSSKPVGGNETLNFLHKINNEGNTFPLYVSSGNLVRYKIEISDFVVNQKELELVNWDISKIKYYHNNFSEYKDSDGKKKAKIVFLAESITKLEPIPVSNFKFYKNFQKPVHHNLAPIKWIPDGEKSIELEIPNDKEKQVNSPLNQIFFGPPGTGKTYRTINEALRILGVDAQDTQREQLKEEFDKRVAAGQIVFTTFHQSMNYEEFIEGIKPNLDNGDIDEEINTEIEYVIKPGIFKRISERARNSINSQYSFDDLWNEYYNNLISKGAVEFTSVSSELKLEPSESKIERLGVRFKKSYDPDAAEGKKVFPVSKNIIKKLFDNQIDATESNARQEIRAIVGGGRATTYYAVYKSFYDFVSSKGKLNSKKQNYVLIIDEINRGNVSQIFGELITLIEKDKRLGKEEELKVTLPYSHDKFGVPDNLYIIGTMNTADRSVEALDTALRRRFSFREMPPIPELLEPTLMLQRLWLKYEDLQWDDPKWISVEKDFLELHKAKITNRKAYELLEQENDLNLLPIRFKELIQFEGINLEILLKTINRRIEKLLDRDHLIGHSYLIQAYSWAELEKSFYENIIPLLQEYFYGDYAKIGAILGEGFVRKQDDNLIEFASGFEAEIDNERVIYQIIDYREGYPGNQYKQPDMTFEKAILKLMNLPIA
ncbi:5-methylcytosine-specific restriction protein B [Algoriphagus boseongensis]|uniref:5-methylcytosine-specific restriction protein B n=1 Tax=Algoriphagus boseongensis TaxID=1442587 RepID=A0A4R6T7H4_9BACT|nr:AAA family ATPase [Algoriphagus boseongensis]TDQ18606.1 5-methylcytosine-specific restriction protein B [Algoriphagus boseongensis]